MRDVRTGGRSALLFGVLILALAGCSSAAVPAAEQVAYVKRVVPKSSQTIDGWATRAFILSGATEAQFGAGLQWTGNDVDYVRAVLLNYYYSYLYYGGGYGWYDFEGIIGRMSKVLCGAHQARLAGDTPKTAGLLVNEFSFELANDYYGFGYNLISIVAGQEATAATDRARSYAGWAVHCASGGAAE